MRKSGLKISDEHAEIIYKFIEEMLNTVKDCFTVKELKSEDLKILRLEAFKNKVTGKYGESVYFVIRIGPKESKGDFIKVRFSNHVPSKEHREAGLICMYYTVPRMQNSINEETLEGYNHLMMEDFKRRVRYFAVKESNYVKRTIKDFNDIKERFGGILYNFLLKKYVRKVDFSEVAYDWAKRMDDKFVKSEYSRLYKKFSGKIYDPEKKEVVEIPKKPEISFFREIIKVAERS